MNDEVTDADPTEGTKLSRMGLLRFVQIVIERYFGQMGDLENEVHRIYAKKTRDEDARKRFFSANLVTTPNRDRIASRQALIIRETMALRPLVEEAAGRVAKIEMARLELHEFRSHERKIARERKENDQRLLTSLTYDFVDCLYSEFGIDGGALSTLNGDDYEAIAAIVLQRHRAVVPELYPQP